MTSPCSGCLITSRSPEASNASRSTATDILKSKSPCALSRRSASASARCGASASVRRGAFSPAVRGTSTSDCRGSSASFCRGASASPGLFPGSSSDIRRTLKTYPSGVSKEAPSASGSTKYLSDRPGAPYSILRRPSPVRSRPGSPPMTASLPFFVQKSSLPSSSTPAAESSPMKPASRSSIVAVIETPWPYGLVAPVSAFSSASFSTLFLMPG